jgi:hypothetical protein
MDLNRIVCILIGLKFDCIIVDVYYKLGLTYINLLLLLYILHTTHILNLSFCVVIRFHMGPMGPDTRSDGRMDGSDGSERSDGRPGSGHTPPSGVCVCVFYKLCVRFRPPSSAPSPPFSHICKVIWPCTKKCRMMPSPHLPVSARSEKLARIIYLGFVRMLPFLLKL